jgi:hypothetical protein
VGPRRGVVLVAFALGLGLTACAGTRIEGGVFHSPKGYRIALPGGAWQPMASGRADLELGRRDVRAGMLVQAACERGVVRRSLDVLARYPLFGLRDRTVLAEEDVSLNGRQGRHTLVEGRMSGSDARMRAELYVVKDARCVYDLLYVAPPAAFEAGRADFHRFVDTLSTE